MSTTHPKNDFIFILFFSQPFPWQLSDIGFRFFFPSMRKKKKVIKEKKKRKKRNKKKNWGQVLQYKGQVHGSVKIPKGAKVLLG